MSTFYKTFAIAGVGGVGEFIALELVKQGATVYALTRDASKTLPQGVIAKPVDYTNEDSIVSALEGVEVVISTLSDSGFAFQPGLARAAKKAGVKLFAPSEYGNPTVDRTTGPLTSKTVFHKVLKELNLPYSLIFTGPFSDWFFSTPFFSLNLADKKFIIVGAGDQPITWTTRADIGRFVAYVFTHTSPEELANSELYLEGDRATLLDVVKAVEEVKGFKVALEHRDVAEVKAKIGPDPRGFTHFADWLGVEWAEGRGAYTNENSNALYPGFKFESVADALAKYY